MSTPKDGGPAYPVCFQHRNLETEELEVSAVNWGMSLRDWFAANEKLAEWDNPESVASNSMIEALAGPRPVKGWAAKTKDEWVEMLTWDATWRAKLKYLRADAMLKARDGLV